MAVDFLPCSTAQLNLDVVLANGQSFRFALFLKFKSTSFPNSDSRWKREEGGRNSWIGTAHHRLWRLWRPDGNRIAFEILCNFHNESDESEVEKNGADILKEYFQVFIAFPFAKMSSLSSHWSLTSIWENFTSSGPPNAPISRSSWLMTLEHMREFAF